MRKVLITGNLGMLGSELSLACEDQGDEVVGVDLPDGDITNRERLLGLIGEADPEFIFHCAAFTKVDQCETEIATAMRVNAIGTQMSRWPPSRSACRCYTFRPTTFLTARKRARTTNGTPRTRRVSMASRSMPASVSCGNSRNGTTSCAFRG
ncbi:MAG: sugar nucleotide-binding protein [bacterium]|nr:sugar nucleotide-binding protein [bacterium]